LEGSKLGTLEGITLEEGKRLGSSDGRREGYILGKKITFVRTQK
jgi:flagellar biosynthesis/type III secretory pathway protein FliH